MFLMMNLFGCGVKSQSSLVTSGESIYTFFCVLSGNSAFRQIKGVQEFKRLQMKITFMSQWPFWALSWTVCAHASCSLLLGVEMAEERAAAHNGVISRFLFLAGDLGPL